MLDLWPTARQGWQEGVIYMHEHLYAWSSTSTVICMRGYLYAWASPFTSISMHEMTTNIHSLGFLLLTVRFGDS